MIDKKLFWVLAVLAAFDLLVAGMWWFVWAMGHTTDTAASESLPIMRATLASAIVSAVLPGVSLLPGLVIPQIARLILAARPIAWFAIVLVALAVTGTP